MRMLSSRTGHGDSALVSAAFSGSAGRWSGALTRPTLGGGSDAGAFPVYLTHGSKPQVETSYGPGRAHGAGVAGRGGTTGRGLRGAGLRPTRYLDVRAGGHPSR